jgi:hypothetical protein
MKHFTYEIDEKSVSGQLKGLRMPLREDSWERFEAYSAAQAPVQLQSSRLREFQLNVNRKVVVPVVFTGAVITLSLLLFNFVNIKNPSAPRNISVAEKPVVIKAPIIIAQPLITTPVKSIPQVSEAAPVAVKPTDTEIKMEKPSPEISSGKLNIEGIVKRTDTKIVSEPEILTSIKPDVVTEDSEAEIRPN